MKAIGSAIWSVPRAMWHATRRVFSLIHNWDEVRETYGDNPNGLTDEQKLVAHGVTSSIINNGSFGM